MPDTSSTQEELVSQLEKLQNDKLTMTQKIAGLERDIAERFEELGTLTQRYLAAEQEARDLRTRNTALHNKTKALSHDLSKTRLEEYKTLLKASPLFDEIWYLNEYEDVGKSDVDPLEHFILLGAQEYRNPSAAFNTYWYVSQHKDVQNSTANPLVHYIRNGIKEGRQPLPPSAKQETPDEDKESTQ